MVKRQKQFTPEQIEILFKNPNVESINPNTIKFTSAINVGSCYT